MLLSYSVVIPKLGLGIPEFLSVAPN